MKIAVVSANLGSFDPVKPYVAQSVEYDYHLFKDENFPRRHCAMTSRLQARIPKCFGWQMAPGYDIYIWVDSSFSLQNLDSVKWLVEQVKYDDVAVLQHPMRNTIRDEALYLKNRLVKEKSGQKDPYVITRYENELIDEQLNEIFADGQYVDCTLFASTVFVYRNSRHTQEMLKEWWYHISRYHQVDQLSFPYVLWKTSCRAHVIPTQHHHDFKIPYLTLTRYQ